MQTKNHGEKNAGSNITEAAAQAHSAVGVVNNTAGTDNSTGFGQYHSVNGIGSLPVTSFNNSYTGIISNESIQMLQPGPVTLLQETVTSPIFSSNPLAHHGPGSKASITESEETKENMLRQHSERLKEIDEDLAELKKQKQAIKKTEDKLAVERRVLLESMEKLGIELGKVWF